MWQHLPQYQTTLPTDPLETLPVYTNVFGKIGLVTLGVAVVMLLMVPWLKRMIATPESH